MHLISSQAQFVILPPARSAAPRAFKNIEASTRRYDQMLAEMQRLRGLVYLRDGAIKAGDLTADGRHKAAVDERGWHILALDADKHVSGCLRFLEENGASRFDELFIRHAAVAQCPVWGAKFRHAVETEMARARQKRMGFGEVGGWAIAEERRGTMDPLRMVLATCSLFRLLGGCTGVATATVRHGSSTILRRIGLRPFAVDGAELPSYYDPRYGCEMEALRFDSDFPSPKYANAIDELMSWMKLLPVICREERVPEWFGLLRGVELPAARPTAMPSLQPLALPQPAWPVG